MSHTISLEINNRILSIELNKIGSLYYSYMYPNYAYYSYAYSYGYDYYHYADEKGPRHRRRDKTQSWSERLRRVKRWLRQTFLPMD